MEKVSEFEYGELFCLSSRESLQQYLCKVWEQHSSQMKDDEDNLLDENEKPGYQGFLSFDGDQARTKNYIGFVQTKDCHIEIYPKVFREHFDATNDNKKLFLKHIFFWFEYCRKWKFPVTKIELDLFNDVEFPELIINLMARHILEVISNTPVSLYQELEESLLNPRGRINFSRYIANGLTNGNQHILECDYEPLLFDNNLNRVIKYSTRLLQSRAKFDATKQTLNEITFILDEVEDIPCTIKDLNSIKLNSFFTDYQYVIDICRMILEQQIYSNEHYEQSQWSLLFPMEYIFEDFVAGFVETHFSKDWKVEYQKSNLNLSNDPEAFQMRHDILITSRRTPDRKIVIDTKYKIRYPASRTDAKKGIAQNDMYQMTSYALRRGCKEVLLLYPNHSELLQQNDTFSIDSRFDSSHKIKITAAELPFWSMSDFSKENLTRTLKDRIENLLL